MRQVEREQAGGADAQKPGERWASVWQEDFGSLYSSLSSPQRFIPNPTLTLTTFLDLSSPLPNMRKSSQPYLLLTSHRGEGMQVSLGKAGRVLGSQNPLRVRQISGLSIPYCQAHHSQISRMKEEVQRHL